MPIKSFEDHFPEIAKNAFIDDTAYISGQVLIGEYSSIWPLCVVRGDVNYIHIGAKTNIQDGCVLHVTHGSHFGTPEGYGLIIGDYVTVGHKAVLHACTIGNRCLIGMSSTIMDNAQIGDDTIIAAGSLVPPNKILESGFLWKGNPISKARPLTDKEREFLTYSAEHYIRLAERTHRSND